MAVYNGRVAFVPKDATKREHVGRVERVVWAAEDDTRVILALTDGSSMIGPGARSQFLPNEQYRFHGNWRDGPRGPQFLFDTFTRDQPHTMSGVVKYLADVCTGVGRTTATALFERYGPDAVRKLREEPGEIAAAGFLSEPAAEKAAADLEQYKHLETTRVALFDLFAGRGFPGKLIDACLSKWGVAAPDRITRQPFRLLVNKLPGCGFKRVDRLYLDRGFPADSLKRQALAGWNAFKEDRSGSTWLTADECVQTILSLVPTADPIKAIRVLVRAGWVQIHRDGNDRYLALTERANAERGIARHIRRLNAAPSLWPTGMHWSTDSQDKLPSAHQVGEFLTATDRPVGCCLGGPGTGKTFTLAAAVRQLATVHGLGTMWAAAPTGKAASRTREALVSNGVNLFTSTIHSLLGIRRNGHDGDGWGFDHDHRNPLPYRFIFIDETSMVDADLFCKFLDACADGTHVLFVGDPFQLPPVGHGAPLRDILASGVVPTGELTEVRRNAGDIVRGCKSIKAGEPVVFSERLEPKAEDPKNLRVVEVGASQVLNTVEDILQVVKPQFGFDPIAETQVITGLNEKGNASRKELNARLGKLLNPDGRAARGNPFRVGDKVICLRNTRLRCVAPTVRNLHPSMVGDADAYLPQPFYRAPGDPPEGARYVTNGDSGRVVAVSEKASVVRFGGADVPLVEVKVGKRPVGNTHEESEDGGKTADFDHAWAITVHKSQGSEWPCVLCVIDDSASQIADRNYWYTAISRARSACLLIGPKDVFGRQVKRQAIDKRRTFLADQLRAPVDAG